MERDQWNGSIGRWSHAAVNGALRHPAGAFTQDVLRQVPHFANTAAISIPVLGSCLGAYLD